MYKSRADDPVAQRHLLHAAAAAAAASCRVQLQHSSPSQHAERYHHHQQTPLKRPGSQTGHMPCSGTGGQWAAAVLCCAVACVLVRMQHMH